MKKIIDFIKHYVGIESSIHLKGFNKSNTTYAIPQWLASFSNAKFVVTDSFHGMVFSIIFEKDFIVIGNRERGLERFSSLLSLLGLEDRLVYKVEDLKNKQLSRIDYTSVNKTLNKLKESSKRFL